MKIGIITLDTPNKNNRTYTALAVQGAIALQGDAPVLGRIGLSEDGELNLNLVSHSVKDLAIENGILYGTLKILNTPAGKVLEELYKPENIQYGFRPAGIGTIDENGVVSDYRFTSIDFVMDPA